MHFAASNDPIPHVPYLRVMRSWNSIAAAPSMLKVFITLATWVPSPSESLRPFKFSSQLKKVLVVIVASAVQMSARMQLAHAALTAHEIVCAYLAGKLDPLGC